MTSNHPWLPRRRFLTLAATASSLGLAGCTDESADPNSTDRRNGDESSNTSEEDASGLGTEVEVSQTPDSVTIEVLSTGRATALSVERLDERHEGPEDAEELPGEEVSTMDLAGGSYRNTLSGNAKGRYAVVASNPQGEREVVASFTIPQE